MAISTCPDGHQSDWDDYCSVCGAAMPSSGSAPTGPSSDERPLPTCSNCGAVHQPQDVFCESCGLDFASGTLPGSETTNDPPASPGAAPGVVVVEVDREWFAQAVRGDELQLPDPEPAPIRISLPGAKALIGRESTSRGVFPEVDVVKTTGDPAVSSRHALIERGADGWTITDVGSTNGTLVGSDLASASEIAAGTPVQFGPGQSAWLGAWTRVTLTPSSEPAS